MASLAYDDRYAEPVMIMGHGIPSAERRVAWLIENALLEMQAAGRHAVRIVDIGCGSGAVLIRALVCARSLGFVAIEGRGVDRSGDDIMVARWATRGWADPAIGLSFEVSAIDDALAREEDGSVDILLYARSVMERLPIATRSWVARDIRRIANRLIIKGEHPAVPAGGAR